MLRARNIALVTCLISALPCIQALQVDVNNAASVKTAAKTVAGNIVSYYETGAQPFIPGLLPAPAYWWEAGSMSDTLIHYWAYTGDTQYNQVAIDAINFQRGDDDNFMPANQTSTEGNDDQGFWALAAMSAAEYGLPASSSGTSWLTLAMNVFNQQVARWDTANCGGGLRWQIFSFNAGYNYKNSISNLVFMQLAARLGLHTGNSTYTDWATQTWTWLEKVQLIGSEYNVYDGTEISTGCSEINRIEWSYNNAGAMYASAIMYNMTAAATESSWQARVEGLLATFSKLFTNNSVIFEATCETEGTCSSEQHLMKGIAARWLAETMIMAPFTAATIQPIIDASAQGAANACSGNSNSTCGFKWTAGSYDNSESVETNIAALDVLQATLAGSNNQLHSANATANGTMGAAGTASITTTSTQPTVTPFTNGASRSQAFRAAGITLGWGLLIAIVAAL